MKKTAQKLVLRFKKFARKNQKELIFLLLILFLASFLRLYRIDQYLTFLGDEGRDALAVKRMITDFKFRLIGPVTSIGNMYLGPLYYYLILPSMILSGLSPVGPAVMVAFLGILSVGLIWWLGRNWFGPAAGLIAAFLYSISPVVIIHSRSSWNPNVMPFFALLCAWGIYLVWQKKQFFWLGVIGLSLSFALQSHYLGLLLIPTLGFFWLLSFKKTWGQKKERKNFLKHSTLMLAIFLLLTVAPLVWFDLRHGGINYQAFKTFFTVRQTTVNLKFYKAGPKMVPLVTQIFTRLLAGKDEFWGPWVTGFFWGLIGLFFLLKAKKEGSKKISPGFWLLMTWFTLGLVGLGNYKQHIYDHYFGFFFPVPFLLFGWIWREGWARKWGKIVVLAFLGLLVFLSWQKLPLRFTPQDQLGQTKAVARFVLEKAKGEPFNLALIAERNYHDAYAYFMEIWGCPPLKIDPLDLQATLANQLFVICEKRPCEPINHPLPEIANFGWAKVSQQWEFKGLKIYQLVHAENQKN